MPRLIVNADDFGLTAGVNRAILELHRQGVLTSATLMARAPATQEAIDIAQSTPTLGVGCHIVLVDGDPILSGARDIPHVADPVYGRFEPSLLQFLHTIYSRGERKKVLRQIEAEARAQIQSLQQRGVRLTHIDTHKHTHMFPRVLRPVLRAARACGLRAVRNPFEPAWSVAATPRAPILRRAQVRLLRFLARSFHRIVAEEGCVTTSGALGVLATGTLDTPTLQSLLAALAQKEARQPAQRLPAHPQPVDEVQAEPVYELVTHPGYHDADLAQTPTRLQSSRDIERHALAILAQLPAQTLTTFATLTRDAS